MSNIEEMNIALYAQILASRAKAVECMTNATIAGKEGTEAYIAARCLETDMQRIMHNQFEV